MAYVYSESPQYWPNGLSLDQFDTSRGEGVFLVRAKSANMQPVGFVGWQERFEQGEKIGYYSIGILPEYRGKGFAKEAVKKLITIKSANVDKVVALIEKGNYPSQALARALGVTVKQALFTGGIEKQLEPIGEAVPSIAADVKGLRNEIAPMRDHLKDIGNRVASADRDIRGLLEQSARRGRMGAGALVGSGVGFLLSDLLPDSTLLQRRRKQTLRVLASLLGAGTGAYIGGKV